MPSFQDWTDQEWAEAIAKRAAEVDNNNSTTDYRSGIPAVSELAKYIDHTQLKPDATEQQIDQLCREAKEYGFKSCCVNSSHVKRCVRNLEGSHVVVACVVGFPLGAMDTSVKVFEAETAFSYGAVELDMVIPVGLLKSQRYAAIYNDISSVAKTKAVTSAETKPRVLKVIIETGLLTRSEIIVACFIAQAAGADFVKTCTGFSGGKATPDDVRLMKKTVECPLPGSNLAAKVVRVKASAGIRTYADTLALIKAGADRIGASAGVTIMKEASGQSTGSGIGSSY